MWMRGVLFGRAVKESMHERSWAAAEWKKRALETPNIETKSEPVTIGKAQEVFLSKLRGDGVQPDTIRKYKLLFSQLDAFSAGRFRYLHELTFDHLLSFREAWTESPATRNKKLDRLKSFFSSSHDAGWLRGITRGTSNPQRHRGSRSSPFPATSRTSSLRNPRLPVFAPSYIRSTTPAFAFPIAAF
jgi:hypothetical protein